jgi:hypothetical protein
MKIRPFNNKSQLERLLDSKPSMPSVDSSKATKAGLITAGGLAGLTAASAAISSRRRRTEGSRNDS